MVQPKNMCQVTANIWRSAAGGWPTTAARGAGGLGAGLLAAGGTTDRLWGAASPEPWLHAWQMTWLGVGPG